MTTKYTQEELNQTGIYAIIHRESGKLYIGSAGNSFRKRWAVHKYDLRRGKHHSIYLQRAWNKYSEFAFEFKILEIVPKEEWLDDKYLIDVEQMWLDSCQSCNPKNGYNISSTAGSPLGYKHTEEARRKMSEANKGKTLSEEHRRKIREACKAAGISEEKYKKIVEANAKTYSFLSPEGEIITITNLSAFCREKGLQRSKMTYVFYGEQNQHKGWRRAA